MDFVVYGAQLSPFVRKVEVCLREKGLEYEFETVNIMNKPDWFLEISPAGRIPVLRDRRIGTEGVPGTIPDSSAICAYLERIQPEPALYPTDPYELGRALFYEEYADSELAARIGMGVFRPILFPRFQGKDPDVERARKTLTDELPPLFDYLEGELDGRETLVGERLSIADIALACQMANLELVAGLPDRERWPALVGHAERVRKRPSFDANLAVCRKIIPEPVDLGA